MDRFQTRLMIAGIPLSILTAVYTAYLFAQAKARDMWQNPLLPPHLFFQSLLLGSAVLLPLLVWCEVRPLLNGFSALCGRKHAGCSGCSRLRV